MRERLLKLTVRGFSAAASSLTLAVSASAQFSANIDINAGGSVPSSGWGAAAGQAGVGVWNNINYSMSGPVTLRGLDGNLTSIVLSGPKGGVGGADNFQGNTGDYAKLLNDGRLSSHDLWTFDGVPRGRYLVFSYVCYPTKDFTTNSAVSVSDSITPNPQYTTGPMPGNQFLRGITHSVHVINVQDGAFSITVDRGVHSAYVSGFQVVAIPPVWDDARRPPPQFLSLPFRSEDVAPDRVSEQAVAACDGCLALATIAPFSTISKSPLDFSKICAITRTTRG